MKNKDQQLEELSAIASTKCALALFEIADEYTDPSEDIEGYWDMVDGIELGLSKSKSKREVFAVDYRSEEDPDNDQPSVYLFVDTYTSVKKQIEALPNKWDRAQRIAFVGKITEQIEYARFAEFTCPDKLRCTIYVDADRDHWHGRVIDGIKIEVMTDPQRRIKKPYTTWSMPIPLPKKRKK